MSPPSLHVHYRHFNATTGQSATEADFGTFLPCSSLSAFPLAFRLLLPTFHQRACITVLPPLCRMPQCHRQVIALLVARTVRLWLLTWLENRINDTSSNGSLHAPFLAMAMTEQAHHCSSGLTKTFTCVQLSNTYLSATLTTATFPTAAACRGFDASACTPTPRDLLSSHWQLRLHFIWKGSQPFIYRCAPRGTRTGTLVHSLGAMDLSLWF